MSTCTFGQQSREYYIPDLLRDWPWSRRLSAHYVKAKADSSAWVYSYRPFDACGQKSFDACDLNLLASLTYSNRDEAFVRLGCDLMNFYFIYDEYTDIADEHASSQMAQSVLDVMKNPGAELDASRHLLARMTKEFCIRSATLAPLSSSCFKRFLRTSEAYFHAVIGEAQYRASEYTPSFQEYMPFRRDTCGARPTLVLTEFGLNLPDYVTSHPVMSALMEDAVDLIIFVNDLHSYRREAASGLAASNILTVIMKDFKLDLEAALEWLAAHCAETASRFLENLQKIPSWTQEVDEKVKIYVDGLGQWVRGNDDWSYESKRYYGEQGLSIKATRALTLQGGREVANYLQQVDGGDSKVVFPATHDNLFVDDKCQKVILSSLEFKLPWLTLLGTFMYYSTGQAKPDKWGIS
ncbi:hypothetical protein D9619_008947 [Psilocybe cf. subviscida]|uniref:Terpene synthase n=1 Tax=Psilocybe cf. subviscida TaxID=2480587 RepID=A0A8H5BUA3_9AGAR|nr:hypothetical protein D9619_008947 [Psilocybe cf. subviscida]